MIINEHVLDIEPKYNFELLAPKERIIFFDIETTGLSAAKSSMYLIGTVMYDTELGKWKLRQYFAESLYEESELIEHFFRQINERKKLGRLFLISFNGDGFDIPYIKNCIRQYSLDLDFTGTYSIDLFKRIKPYKKLAGLSDCKLKTVEKLCGIFREDRYNGGELIYVYEEYLRLSNLDPESCEYNENNLKLREHLLKALLLHNAEDIVDMPMIMDILGYDSMFEGGFEIYRSEISGGSIANAAGSGEVAGSVNVINDAVWDIHARLSTPLPKGIFIENDDWVISISEEDPFELNIAVKLFEGELKYFFADYKNYYYLPAEDTAIHKSVGEFVDKKARKQATARTCYQKKYGLFVPEPEAVFAPMFYEDYKVTPAYGLLPEGSIGNDTVRRYIMAVLKNLK